MSRADDCRAAAARVLAAVLNQGTSLNEPLALELGRVAPRDRALLQQLCYGSLRSFHRLDAVLEQTLQKPLKKKDADIRALLVIGLYQLMEMRTPDHAAISTAVEACRALDKPWATGLVNGVLRRCSRESAALLAGLDPAQSLSHPEWLLRELQSAWPDHWQQLVDANNSHPPMCLRVNNRRTSRDEYLEELSAAGIEAASCTHSGDGIRLSSPRDVTELPGFDGGLVSVQDEAAQLAAILLAPMPGDRVLDACAAPGGKTCHLLELQAQLTEVVAMDSDPDRLLRVADNLERLELSAQLLEGDARKPPQALVPASFDRILVDAPCSGSGVIRRHPDIKLLRREQDMAMLAQTQREILQGSWPLLRPGGQLLYATCSIFPVENRDVVDSFIASTEDASLSPITAAWGEDQGGMRTLLSSSSGSDGMFYALINKAG